MPPTQTECPVTTPVQTTDAEESCSKCIFDRLPPEMIRFIFRKQSTDDLLQASGLTDRLYRVAQHHMYLSEGALLVRGGQDTAATVTQAFNVGNVTSLYLVDVRDFDRDVPPQLWRRLEGCAESEDGPETASTDSASTDGASTDSASTDTSTAAPLRVLHVGYTKNVGYKDLVADGVRRLLGGVRAERVCFDNVSMTAEDVADVVSARLEADIRGSDAGPPPVLRCAYDRADDDAVLALLDQVQCTCAGLLAEFRVTVRRPAPRAYAVYPTCRPADTADTADDADAAAAVAAEVPEDLLSMTAYDCSGLGPGAYRRLAAACRRLRRLSVRCARRADDASFEAMAAIAGLLHLHVHGMVNVTSDGLLNGLERARGLQSLALAECPYVTDEVLRSAGQLRQLRRLQMDLTGCDKTTAAGVLDMLSAGCERVQELWLTVPLDADYVAAVAAAAQLPHLREFRLTFDRLSWHDYRADDRPAADWRPRLDELFRDRGVDFTVRHAFTKITVTVD